MTSSSAPKDSFFWEGHQPLPRGGAATPSNHWDAWGGAAHPRCWGTEEDRKRGDKARGNGATSFQVPGDGGTWTQRQTHDDRGVHQQPQAENTIYIINNSIIATSEEANIITWVWALPLATAKLGGGAPVSYHHHSPIFTDFLSSILLVISWSSRIKF